MEGSRALEHCFALARPEVRAQAAGALARHLGAEALMLFARDVEAGAFLPAKGLPRTIPGGPEWRDLLRRCEVPGEHRGQVAYPTRAELAPAIAISTAEGLVFILIGGEPRLPPLQFLCLPLLASTLAAELQVGAAAGLVAAAQGELRHAAAVTSVLDATRAELERTLDETRRLYAELKAADRQKDEFLAMLAHELRNPLAAIVSAVGLLRRGGEAAGQEKVVSVLDRQGRHLTRLVDDLLDVSRINRGYIELRREPSSIAAAIQQAAEVARPLIEAERHQLSVSMPETPLYVLADPVRLTQIFGNLLTNAAKYTAPGGRISIAAVRQEGWAEVRIRDNGMGIEPEMLGKVFDLFTQAPRSLDRAKGGLGVGLTLVQRLLALQGGSVEASSEGAGRGSEFIVRLPLVEMPAKAALGPAGPPGFEGSILLIEDNVDAADMLAEVLRLSGATVFHAKDGESGIRLADEVDPDLVVLDIGLPKMDGYEVAVRLRISHPRTRLIALSGYGGDATQLGADRFDAWLVKPIEVQELLMTLDSLRTAQPRAASR